MQVMFHILFELKSKLLQVVSLNFVAVFQNAFFVRFQNFPRRVGHDFPASISLSGAVNMQRGARHQNSTFEQILSNWILQQSSNTHRTSALSNKANIAWISAKFRNVALNPFQGFNNVVQTKVGFDAVHALKKS